MKVGAGVRRPDVEVSSPRKLGRGVLAFELDVWYLNGNIFVAGV